MIGTNNTGYDRDRRSPRNTTAEVIEGIGAVVSELKVRLPGAKILLLGLLPRGKADAPVRGQIRLVNEGISRLADGSDGQVIYRDIGAAFLNAAGEIPADVMPDALHPNEKGYEIFFAGIRDLLPSGVPHAP